ncbi:MAG: addiction module toxin, HicA family [Alphaproteobacteria bacterium]|nr:addiction module toxin, HicA family [Alphaproteobacteria bacterium]
MKFRDFIRILEQHGFVLRRQSGGSHAIYRGTVKGKIQQVVVAGAGNDDIKPGTLGSMIRQSGLPNTLFRRSF